MTQPKAGAAAKPVQAARRKVPAQKIPAPKRGGTVAADNDEVIIERVLKAASTLLTTKGLPAFNMNAVAALAAVDLPTLYRHFKDRTSLLQELYQRVMGNGVNEILDIIRAVKMSEEEVDTIALVHRQIDRIVEKQLAEPELVSLRQSIRAIPELAVVDQKWNEGFSNAVEFVLRTQLPDMNARRARSVAVTIVEAGTALVELCARRPKEAREISREIGVLIVGYIREVMSPQSTT